MIFKYRKAFGALRFMLGFLFLAYPVIEFLNNYSASQDEHFTWLFAIFFFLLYTISATRNGIKEFNLDWPHFNLLRFFEIALNGFISLYLVILIFWLELRPFGITLFILAVVILIIHTFRDIRLLSIQYYDRKKKAKEMENQS